jgi:hypothetical protein
LFHISLPHCPLQGQYFHDHGNVSEPISIEFHPDALEQPPGSTFMGYFQSFKYFSDPAAQQSGK